MTRARRTRHRAVLLAGLCAALVAGLASGCGGGSPPAAPTPSLDASDWTSVLARARGQQVTWSMYGGDDVLNGFVTGYLAQRLRPYGVTVRQVRVTDTADAVDGVLAEKQAGRSSGSTDLVWVNGENFATGRQAGLWSCGWPSALPNARHVDASDPAVTRDFGVPVDGCESVWQQADSALVYDSAKLSAADVASVSSLFAWARSHPGRFTYPAPPDFTGSMAVRTFLYDTAGGPQRLQGPVDSSAYPAASAALWTRLRQLAPSLWRGGSTYPTTQDDVQQLYADGEVDAFLTYGPGAVAEQVRRGVYPATTREAVPSPGNIANDSSVAIPYDAPHRAAALVVANELLDPAVQLELYRADGAYPAVDLDRVPTATRDAFAAVDLGPSVLPLEQLTANTQPELAAAYVTRIEKDWAARVLQR